jgi:hypothetical protein
MEPARPDLLKGRFPVFGNLLAFDLASLRVERLEFEYSHDFLAISPKYIVLPRPGTARLSAFAPEAC